MPEELPRHAPRRARGSRAGTGGLRARADLWAWALVRGEMVRGGRRSPPSPSPPLRARGVSLGRRFACPLEVLWEHLTRPARIGAWVAGEAPCRPVTPGPPGVGTCFLARWHVAGRGGGSREAVLTEWQPRARYVLSSREWGLNVLREVGFSAHPRGASLRLDIRVWPEGRWWPRHSLAVMLLWSHAQRRLRRVDPLRAD